MSEATTGGVARAERTASVSGSAGQAERLFARRRNWRRREGGEREVGAEDALSRVTRHARERALTLLVAVLVVGGVVGRLGRRRVGQERRGGGGAHGHTLTLTAAERASLAAGGSLSKARCAARSSGHTDPIPLGCE